MNEHIFDILGIGSREDSYTDLIAYAFEHSSEFRQNILTKLGEQDYGDWKGWIRPPIPIKSKSGRKKDVPDLILFSNKKQKVLLIENKVFSCEGWEQTKRYASDEFKKNFLENAVPYNFWRNGIRKRLIMERVIEKDLGERITIIPENIIKYYEGYNEGRNENSDSTIGPDDINKKIIKHLRREKSEKMYGPWLGDLKKKYNIKVNMTEWNKIIKG